MENFYKLPLEMKAHILSYLEQKERQRLRLVSRSFNYAIETCYGIHVKITNSNLPDLLRSNSYILGATAKSLALTDTKLNKALATAFFERLRCLEFIGHLTISSLITVLKSCKDLETLVVKNFVVNSNWKFNVRKTIISLPRLKCFKMECNNTKQRTPVDLIVLLVLLRNVLTNPCVGLTYLEILAPYHITVMLYNGIFGQNLNFVQYVMHRGFMILREVFKANRKTIRTVSLQQSLPEGEQSTAASLGGIAGPIHLELWPPEPESADEEEEIQLQGIDLTNIKFSSKSIEAEFLTKVLAVQKKLKTLICKSSSKPQWQIAMVSIGSNSKTLQTIYLDFSKLSSDELTPQFKILRGSLFQNCSGLTNLTLLQKENYLPLVNKHMQLTDVHLLPQSLRSFTTSLSLNLKTSDLKKSNLDNLKGLTKLEMYSTSSPWFLLNSSILEVLEVNHVQHLLKSMPSLRTMNLKCKYMVTPVFRGSIRRKTTQGVFSKDLVSYVSNNPGLRCENYQNFLSWKNEYLLSRELKVTVLPAFRLN